MPCYNPATKELLGHMPAMDTEEVKAKIRSAQKAAEVRHFLSSSSLRMFCMVPCNKLLLLQSSLCRWLEADVLEDLMCPGVENVKF